METLENPFGYADAIWSRFSAPTRAGSFAPGTPGVFVKLEGTIKAFKGIVAGDYDALPEAAFYMVGTIEEAVVKAKKLAAEAA